MTARSDALLPNLFVVGAVKCGTTSLHRYLSHHPDVFVSARKELHYFNFDHDHSFRGSIRALDEYLPHHADGAGRLYRADVSPLYIYSRVAAAEIKAHVPAARIVVMLRNPVDVAHALHAQRLSTGNETEVDFARALSLEDERVAGRRLPARVRFPEALHYRRIGLFADQVERYFAAFGRDRVHVILYDDIAADVAAEYRRLLQFLGLREVLPASFPAFNPSTQVRSRLIATALGRTPLALRALAQFVLPRRKWRSQLVQRLRAGNRRAAARRPIDPALGEQLRAFYRSDVERLEQLIGRPLPAWK